MIDCVRELTRSQMTINVNETIEMEIVDLKYYKYVSI